MQFESGLILSFTQLNQLRDAKDVDRFKQTQDEFQSFLSQNVVKVGKQLFWPVS